MTGHPPKTGKLRDLAWAHLLAARGWHAKGLMPASAFGIRLSSEGDADRTDADDERAGLIWRNQSFEIGPALGADSQDLMELYLPVLSADGERPMVVGHLGQSIDAQIATRSGDSCYVTGPANLTHLHRMRALCDAVVVGAGTVATDDPRLTTRLVAGPNPVRVVIDPDRRLSGDQRIFHDGQAETLLVCAEDRLAESETADERLVGVPRDEAGLDLPAVLSALDRRGLHRLFIEGGGVTVSRWMKAGLLDRLQIATAPVLIGAGRPGISLPPTRTMRACRRPPYRLFQMGQDILWDFDLRSEPEACAEPDRDELVRLL